MTALLPLPQPMILIFAVALTFILPASADAEVASIQAPSFLQTETVRLSQDSSMGSNPLAIQVVSQPQCSSGELDAMMLDFQNSNRKYVLQMSIETLDSHQRINRVGAIDESFRPKGPVIGEFKLDLPHFDTPTVLGVYLCAQQRSSDPNVVGPNAASAADPDRPCSANKVVSFDELMQPHRVDSSKVFSKEGKLQPAPSLSRLKPGPNGHVYYFRYLIAYQDLLYVPTEYPTEEEYSMLKNYLDEIEADVKNSGKLISKLKDHGEKLGSLPLKTSKDGLTIPMPYFSAKKCGGVGGK